MIYIKEPYLQNSNIVSIQDQIIGVVKSNNVEKRIFVLPKLFKGLDLSDGMLTPALQVRPVNLEEPAYTQPLIEEIQGNHIHLTWNITRTHTKDAGTLCVSLLLFRQDGDVVWQSFPYEFTVANGIDATEQMAEIPPSMLEQLVIQAGAYAQSAKVEADRAKQDFDKLSEQLNNLVEFGTPDPPPTKLSQLENDSGYITAGDVQFDHDEIAREIIDQINDQLWGTF